MTVDYEETTLDLFDKQWNQQHARLADAVRERLDCGVCELCGVAKTVSLGIPLQVANRYVHALRRNVLPLECFLNCVADRCGRLCRSSSSHDFLQMKDVEIRCSKWSG